MSITEYVRDDLAARLRSGRELPAQLTLDSLAEFYNVSFTPVRAAIAELIEEGLIEKGPNRRLIIKTDSLGPLPENVNELVPLPERPKDNYPLIVADMVQLSLLGDELHLREEITAEKYGISRSAIRNIFHRLAGEGILDHIPRRGWRLRPFRRDDLQEYVEAREALELKALDLAWKHFQPQALEAILQANDPDRFLDAVAKLQSSESAAKPPPDPSEQSLPTKPQPASLPAVDESLHDYLISNSHNKYIREFFERQGRYYALLFQWEDHDSSVALETIRQHRAIVEAMLDGDHNRARRALSNHILHNHPLLNRQSESLLVH